MNPQIRNRVRCRALLLVWLAMIFAATAPAAAQAPHWVQFHDAKTGLSFRYPPDLGVRQRDPRKFGLPNVEAIVDLIGNTKLNPGTIVLRFLVKRGRTSPVERTKTLQKLHRVCEKIGSLNVDGHKAVVCVSRGSAAVHWSVEILEPRECTILTLLGGADADQALPPPHNGEFPLLSIIRTVRFTSEK